ncbi:zinc finger protein [Colletotrichum tofieldiae]|nr:zinc finger protein [Colletotrichum tofieldiae]
MVSIDQSYTMLPKHLGSEHDDYILYPEPPQGVFSSAPLEMGIPADASYMYPTSMAMDAPSLYDNNFMYQSRTSPGLYEDAEFQLPSSNLSTTSAPQRPPPTSAHRNLTTTSRRPSTTGRTPASP